MSWLRHHRDEANAIADALSEEPGVTEAQVRPFTGSVLVLYDQAQTDEAAIRRAVLSAARVASVTLPGQESPEQIREILERAFREGSQVTKVAVKAFQGIHVDVLRKTG